MLLTTRDANAVYSPALKGFHVQLFNVTARLEVLLNLVGLNYTLMLNCKKAVEITKALRGLPLALT